MNDKTTIELLKEEIDVLHAVFTTVRQDKFGSIKINFANGKVQNMVKEGVEIYRRKGVDKYNLTLPV